MAIRSATRPIRPNPLMPIEIAMLQLPPIRHINEVAISDSFVI